MRYRSRSTTSDVANRTGEPVTKLGGTIDLIFARHPNGIREAGPFEVWDGEILFIVGQRGSSGEELRQLVRETIGRDTPNQLNVTPLVLRLLDVE
jgi:hypothetical protein